MNDVTILGFVGKKPEINYTKAGVAVCNLSIATNEEIKCKDGSKKKHTEWHCVVVWGELAELAVRHLDSGKKVIVVGSLKTTMEKKGSFSYPKTNITASELKFIDGFCA